MIRFALISSLFFSSSIFCSDIDQIQFYLIHGVDKTRKSYMNKQFMRHLPEYAKKVNWINYPNKNDIDSTHLGMFDGYGKTMPKGTKSCCVKHYLIVKDIVEKNIPLAVVMEDNIRFKGSVMKALKRYLKNLPPNWDLLFDSDISNLRYIESNKGKYVHKKSNFITRQCNGSSKGCNFYLINLRAAKKLLECFLPIISSPDFHYNHLFRKLKLNVFWAEPVNVHKIHWPRKTSQEN